MNKIKYIIIIILLIPVILGGYIVNNYYKYESKQEDVKEFRKLAFEGYTLVNQREDKKALAVYEQAIAIYDKDASSLGDLATLYRKDGQLQKAKEFYQKAFEASEENYKHLYNVAIMEYILKDYKKSIELLNKLIHMDKNSSKYYKFLALNYYALKDKEKAYGYYAVLEQRKSFLNDKILVDLKNEYEKLEKKPEPLSIVYKYWKTDDIKELEKLMLQYKKEKYDIKSLRTAQKIIMKEPDHSLANKIAAELLFTHGEIGRAYEYAVRVKEHDAKSLEILGAVLQNTGKFEDAIEAYERSYAKEPKKDILRAMTVCSMRAKKVDEMENYLERLNRIDPLLTTKLVYAIETQNKIEHTFWDKVVYLTQVEFFKIYCEVLGCDDA